MENSLVVRPTTSAAVVTQDRSIPSEHEMMVYHTMAEQAITSKMYGNNHKDKSSVMMIMLSARELGIPPMQALNGGINLIQGKVEISARMMSALIRKAGHQIKVQECTNDRCTLVGRRADTGETQTASFSVAEAQMAGLVKQGGGWTKWPKDMCFARALSRLARQLFSDVIGIGYIEGEIGHSNVQPIIEDVPIEHPETIVVENEEQYISDYVSLFDKEDQFLALEYLKVVQKHFNMTVIETVKTLMEDKNKLFERFTTWKTKMKRAEDK